MIDAATRGVEVEGDDIAPGIELARGEVHGDRAGAAGRHRVWRHALDRMAPGGHGETREEDETRKPERGAGTVTGKAHGGTLCGRAG